MNLKKAIEKRRSIRLFRKKEVSEKILRHCIDQARYAPSANNKQPLEYLIVNNKKKDELFRCLTFGGEIDNKEGRPSAYIVVLDKNDKDIDVGLAVQNIVLTAFSQKLGSCILGAIDREKIRDLFNIPSNLKIKLVIALGYPAEKPVIEETEGPLEYKRKNGVLIVPKRKLKDIIRYEK